MLYLDVGTFVIICCRFPFECLNSSLCSLLLPGLKKQFHCLSLPAPNWSNVTGTSSFHSGYKQEFMSVYIRHKENTPSCENEGKEEVIKKMVRWGEMLRETGEITR